MEASEKPPIGVIGVGWVGLVTARLLRRDRPPGGRGRHRRGEDRALRSGAPLPIHEPGLPELVERNRERLTFTTEMDEVLAAARLLFCCVDTPPTYSGDADLSRVEAVVAALPDGGDHALVMKSTVPAGTGRGDPPLAPRPRLRLLPEFLKEGSAVSDFLEPDRVVIGADPGSEWAADAVAAAYEPLGGELVRTDVASAEMIKLASNAFLATKISFINEIANVCEEVGADVNEVARGMGLDERIGPHFLQAGIGYGGSCFPKDVSALKMLAGNTGYHFQLLNSVIEVNELQKRRVISKLDQAPRLAGRQAGRAARARVQAEHRRHARGLEPGALGAAPGRGRDRGRLRPGRRGPGRGDAARASSSASRPPRRSTGADAAILVTEWPEFAELDWEELAGRMANPLIVDGRNFLDPERLRDAGFTYEGIGRG